MKQSKVVLKIKQDDTPQRFVRRSFKDILDDMIVKTKNNTLIEDYKSVLN
jgi:hypothetical protein